MQSILWTTLSKRVQVKLCLTLFVESHSVSDKRLTAAALVLFLLAADVVEREEQVMSLGQTRRQSQFHLFVEVRRPAKSNRRKAGGEKNKSSQQGQGKKVSEIIWVSHSFRRDLFAYLLW